MTKSVLSYVRLFVDDYLIYKAVKLVQDQISFQQNLDELHIRAGK